MYNAVGIDVSKGKSTIAVLQPGGVIVRKPFDVFHTSQSLKELSNYLASLEGDTRIVMECTGRYHESMANSLSNAGFFVTVVNPHLIKNFGNNTLRKVKSDPADAQRPLRLFIWRYFPLSNVTSFISFVNPVGSQGVSCFL